MIFHFPPPGDTKPRIMRNTVFCLALIVLFSCSSETKNSPAIIALDDLKRGEIINCGPADGELYGAVSFGATVRDDLQKEFNTAVALLHSFEYDESEKMFAKVIDKDPQCAMAYWGVAMSNFHPLWAPPSTEELKKGAKAVEMAKAINNQSKREADYIDAIGKFYEDFGKSDHRSRVLAFEEAMARVYLSYPDDIEASIFYSLALNAAADPTDKTYERQKKALAILAPVFKEKPMHPGLAHYIIHNADYPELAEMALPAARKYASIAPASAHAQHMPSHIFTRLGLWDECIESNLVSVSSAKCYAEQAGLKGHWDEELHALDYLVYAYLQKADDDHAKQQVDYFKTINEVSPLNFKTAYSFAAVPARYLLERKMWNEAAGLEPHPANFPWKDFPWQKGIIHYTRLLGSVHINDLSKAKNELAVLKSLHEILSRQKEKAKEARQVAVQVKAGEAWIILKEGNAEKAVVLMKEAADMEDGMEKHPVTPGEVIPARELLGEMYLELNRPAEAMDAFEQNLRSRAYRVNSLYGASVAARMLGDRKKLKEYSEKIEKITSGNSKRKELQKLASFANDLPSGS